MEAAGNDLYQNDHMGKIFEEGFSFSGFERDKLYLNDGGKRFVDISGLSGLDSVTDGRGAAYADFDNDGDYDIFLTTLQGQAHHLFRNIINNKNTLFKPVSLTGLSSVKEYNKFQSLFTKEKFNSEQDRTSIRRHNPAVETWAPIFMYSCLSYDHH